MNETVLKNERHQKDGGGLNVAMMSAAGKLKKKLKEKRVKVGSLDTVEESTRSNQDTEADATESPASAVKSKGPKRPWGVKALKGSFFTIKKESGTFERGRLSLY
mmetsp:Transcript_21864/g.54883  ORF Transcript_21864/g.54883 Transcript_21864/m.54883 type:complete len:105 (+) Transcript_21864:26-340(+)